MKPHLVGFTYHEPENWLAWQKGITEDFESSTALFVSAATKEEALLWCEKVASEMFRRLNSEEEKSWAEHGHHCWIEEDPTSSSWKHCLDFFQHVCIGEMPDFAAMGTPAYVLWTKAHEERS